MKKQSNDSNNISQIFIETGKIYLKGLQGLGSFLAFTLGALACSAVIVLPFWYLAKNATAVFSFFVLAAALGGAVFLVLRRIVLGRRSRQDSPGVSFVRFLWNFFCIIGFLAWIYLLTVLVLRGMHTAFILLLILFIITFGIYLYARKKSASTS
jgi:uncharacterized membrane protein